MKRRTFIISAFPGCGKSTAYVKLKCKYDVLDSDPSTFDKTYFPNNYIKHIKNNIGKVDIIFISSHEKVRKTLNEEEIPYTLYYPSKERKKEFLELYKQRGNNDNFIKTLDDNFENFIDNIKNDKSKHPFKVELKNEGEFILNDDRNLSSILDCINFLNYENEMKNRVDSQYFNLLEDIMENGTYKKTRAGYVKSVFGRMLKFNLKEGFPILTTKKVFTKGIIHELLWFLKGDTNIKYLVDNNVHIWDDDAYRHYLDMCNIKKPMSKEEFIEAVKEGKSYAFPTKKDGILKYYKAGDLGPVYGAQWRNQGEKHIDQIQNIIDTLKTNPDDRRMICMAWNANDFDEMALPPCHYGFQVYTRELTPTERLEWLWEHSNGEYDEWKSPTKTSLDDLGVPTRELSLMWNQRSVDTFLGLGFNITSYSLLLCMLAQCVNMSVGTVSCSLGDCHIYEAHLDAVKEQLSRDPFKYKLPKLSLNPNIKEIDSFTFEDIKIEEYESYSTIKAPLCVGL